MIRKQYFWKISIITVCYNAVKTIEQTIYSVVNQTYPNIEYIIIDGNSTDGTIDIIKKYEDKIAYWISEPDNGIYDAMNKGIDIATGDYIQFLGADDALVNDYIIDEIVSMIHGEDILSANILNINDTLFIQAKSNNHVSRDNLNYNGEMIPHPGMFCKRKLFSKKKFNINYKIAADYDFFLFFLFDQNVSFKFIDIPVVFFSMMGVSSTNKNGNIEHKNIMTKYGINVNKIAKNIYIKGYIKRLLSILGIIRPILLKCNWEEHICTNPYCRWCKGKGEKYD
ncbi:glycosyltransferase family 2 protein [Sporomusa sphaeroides]|uniref:PGL/p-HBAD biosynthesis glycosyltransferase/MT3031 n=1 Tax=Sporomusa sphaeroides DSM 2875 TaxID=1337886 RepID=A0ABM9W4K5_9FIRM|nr:glycosyltransferase family 2 protein [Sporomusa sphaeroides]OLS55535.1 PGL/p-HBAD biosynthesis glycosyltransferase [Sporomusa sphaeroides DSM 2875]CVK19928.1 PGL/p-HBAD biosynthesis glycosyltransferase/MT3031 [Sporomusa sphaeroides DSM 2875]